MGQVAKIRKDATSGYVIASTGNGNINGAEVSNIVTNLLMEALIPSPNSQVNTVVVAKLSSSLEVEWSQQYGQAEGESQMFDLLVDRCLVTRAS